MTRSAFGLPVSTAFVAAALALAPLPALAQGAGGDGGAGSFAGDNTDPVTGFHCLNQFCETLVLPGNRLCQKANPHEMDPARVVLNCRG